MKDLILYSFLVLVCILVIIYDIVTLPFYLIFQEPWIKWKRRKVIWARRTDETDPRSPYKSVAEPKNLFPNVGTIAELFNWSYKTYGNVKLLGTRELYRVEEMPQKDGKVFKKLVLGEYRWTGMKEADRMITNLARGLRKLGLNPKDKLIFLAETRAEWFLSAHACFRTNIVVATLYTNLGDDSLVIGINETESNHLLVSSELLPKIKKIMPKITNIKHIIYMEGAKPQDLTGFPQGLNIVTYTQLMSSGENADIQLESPTPQDIAVLMYTSGSTGAPKGVLISHKCLMTTVIGAMSDLGYVFREAETYPAYLPLAHILEIGTELFALSQGTKIGYSSPLTLMDNSSGLKRGCKGDLTLLKPVTLVTVPLMLDRIRKSINDVVNSKGTLSKTIFLLAMKYKCFWTNIGFKTPVLNRLIFYDICQVIGGRIKYLICGSAPLSPDTHDFIETCLGAKIIQAYALTETSACGTVARVEDESKLTVGAPLAVSLIRLIDWEEGNYHPTDKPYPRGEVVIGGDGVSVGYFKNEKLTNESYKEENGIRWFYTGDIAEVHPDGCFRIIDRKKDLVKLQFGEYISLGKVEGELLTCPLVDNVCAFGNGLITYMVALVVPNHPQLKKVAEGLHKANLSYSEMCNDPAISREATKLIQKHAANCRLLRMEIPQKIKLCSEEWSPDTGLVTAAFKVKRKAIENFYKEDLDAMMGLQTNGAVNSK